MAWKVAGDIGDRIRDLIAALGTDQQGLAKRAEVYPAQVSNWIRGVQRPSRGRLERWAEREGWSPVIFAEGGPMPSTVVNRPLTGRVAESRVLPGRTEIEARESLWRQITWEMAEYERRGQDAPIAQLAGWLARLGATSGGGAGAAGAGEVERDATEATTLDAHTPPPRQGRQQKPGG